MNRMTPGPKDITITVQVPLPIPNPHRDVRHAQANENLGKLVVARGHEYNPDEVIASIVTEGGKTSVQGEEKATLTLTTYVQPVRGNPNA